VKTQWEFVDDRTPFRFRVASELVDDGFFFGLYGPVESGPSRYRNLICNIMLRFDNSDWHHPFESGASFTFTLRGYLLLDSLGLNGLVESVQLMNIKPK